jgi:hypothetical protein
MFWLYRGKIMKEDNIILGEIREMLKLVADRQEKLMKSVEYLMEEQKKLHEEIKLNNFVLNSISVRSEIIN